MGLLLKVTSTTLYLFFLEIKIQMTKLIALHGLCPAGISLPVALRGRVSWRRLSPCRGSQIIGRGIVSWRSHLKLPHPRGWPRNLPSSKPSSQVETDVPPNLPHPPPGQFFLLVLFGDSSQKPNKQRGGGEEGRQTRDPRLCTVLGEGGGRAHKSLMAQH